jgi:hypothetical protein
MEQDREAKGQKQVEAWVARDKVAVGALEVALQRGRGDIVYVPTVVKKQTINWGLPVMSRNVLNVERL